MPLALVGACDCGDGEGIQREAKRVWGKDQAAAEIEKKAELTIDAQTVDASPQTTQRVLNMTFAEVAARMGPMIYEGKATFDLRRNGRGFEIVEKTKIEQGLNDSWHLTQRDAKDNLLREVFYYNGLYALRNGPGKLRAAGSLNAKTGISRDEAYEPLSTYTKYYGKRLGLSKQGTESVAGRSAVRYDFVLLDGPEFIEVKGMKGKKKPVERAGGVWVDTNTGAVIKAKLKGRFEIPAAKEGGKPGSLKLGLQGEARTVEGRQILPEKEPVATIERHPVDLDPLEFLDGGTRTSTVIGGKKKKKKAALDAGK